MIEEVEQEKPEKLKKYSWWWPGVVASSLAGAAVVAFRGCWHGKMSWPDWRARIFLPGLLELRRQAAVRRADLQCIWSIPL
jgi:hypothetical protein